MTRGCISTTRSVACVTPRWPTNRRRAPKSRRSRIIFDSVRSALRSRSRSISAHGYCCLTRSIKPTFPNDLLHVLDEGRFEIPELARNAGSEKVKVRTADNEHEASVEHGRVQAEEFPFVVRHQQRA